MKKLHPLLSVLFLISVGFSQQEYNMNDLIEMDNGLWTEKFSDEPITGKMFGFFGEENNPKKVHMGNIRNGKKEGKWVSYYHSTGRKMYEQYYKDGKPDGVSTVWYENGQKHIEGIWKDGKSDGLSTLWYENGQKQHEVTYKDGIQDGLLTSWYENGQMKIEGTHKDNKPDGLVTYWYENGQKRNVGTTKDGKIDGLWIIWYENGQKSIETTYKDGKSISRKEWNEDGSVKE